MVLTAKQKVEIATVTAMGLLVLKRRRARGAAAGSGEGPEASNSVDGAYTTYSPLLCPFEELLFDMSLMRPRSDALSRFVLRLEEQERLPSSCFALPSSRASSSPPALDTVPNAQLRLREAAFQNAISTAILAYLESACLLVTSSSQPSFKTLYDRLSLALSHLSPSSPPRGEQRQEEGASLITACTARVLQHVMMERPWLQDSRGKSGIRHVTEVLLKLSEEQGGRWRWDVLDGVCKAVDAFGAPLNAQLDAVPVAVLEDGCFVMQAIETLTLTHLRSHPTALDTILDRLVSLTCSLRHFRLAEAYAWLIVNNVKAAVVEQDEEGAEKQG